MISYGEFINALKTPLLLKSKKNPYLDQAPHFVEYVRKYIEEKYGKEALYKKGLLVYTTLDLNLQRAAQEAVESGLREIERRQKFPSPDNPMTPEGTLVCFSLETGYLKSMVGGRDFKKKSV